MGYPTTDRRGLAISQSIAEIETPALLVDVGRMEQNIQRLTSTLSASDVAIRSHIKSHKIPDLAHQQVRATGADKITCQTLSEAEVMALSGFHDIHLVRMVVSNEKVERLVWLADRVDNFVTNVDCRGNIVPLQDTAARNDVTVPVFLEIDVGVNRTGVTPAEAPAMANLIEEQSNLRLAGIVGHDGFIKYNHDSESAFETAVADVVADLRRAVDRIEKESVEVPTVMTGSSATARYYEDQPLVTEVNPGRYLFWDGLHVNAVPHVETEHCAVTIITTVISNPTHDRVVVDGGSKVFSAYEGVKPQPKDRHDFSIRSLSSEHAVVDVTEADPKPDVGDRIEFIVPSVHHAINLADTLVGVREGRVSDIWDIQARGKSR